MIRKSIQASGSLLLGLLLPAVLKDWLDSIGASPYLWVWQTVCVLWACAVLLSIPRWKRLRSRWWTRGELAKPQEHEYGYHDHKERLKKLWVALSFSRG